MTDTAAAAGGVAAYRYLDVYLAPLQPYLDQADITDIFINRPGELWIERLGQQPIRYAAPLLDDEALWRLARQIASLTHQGISREHPLLAAILPDGSRIQIVAPPATRGPIAIAIRKHVVADFSLDDYAREGAFEKTERIADPSLGKRQIDIGERTVQATLREAVLNRHNIIISGGTATGKTTFLNALLKEVPLDERLILIEDTPEIRINHANAVGLVATKGKLGEASVTTDDLLQASLRMRPDRIILGELRGGEAYSFLRAVNTGHPGSLTTLHADSPQGAIEQLALIILQSGVQLRRSDIVDYVRSVVGLIVQLGRHQGQRRVSQLRVP